MTFFFSEGNPSRSLPDSSTAAAVILKVYYEGNVQSQIEKTIMTESNKEPEYSFITIFFCRRDFRF